MQPYLICLDLDGTLLNDNKEISPYTKQVLTELQQCGHYVMIATGRPYRASQMYYHELNMNTPVVNFKYLMWKFLKILLQHFNNLILQISLLK